MDEVISYATHGFDRFLDLQGAMNGFKPLFTAYQKDPSAENKEALDQQNEAILDAAKLLAALINDV